MFAVLAGVSVGQLFLRVEKIVVGESIRNKDLREAATAKGS